MPKFLLLILFVCFGFMAKAQNLNHVKFYSENQYLMDVETGDIVDEQEYPIEFSINDDEIILDAYGRKTYLQIQKSGQLEDNSTAYQLDGNQFLIINEGNKSIIFGREGAPEAIMYEISKKSDLEGVPIESYLDKGISAFDNGNYAEAIKHFEKSAAEGNRIAMNNLAYIYISGVNGQKNTPEALRWFKKSAEKGDVVAMYNIGLIYDEGDGVKIDRTKALEWYKKASDEDYVLAKYNIGYLYYTDEGGYQDYQKAMDWFKKADAQAYPEAGYYIAKMYLNGLGVEKNKSKAKKWFKRSADLGSEYSREELKKLD